jgi:cytochrome c-type biogenesis protein
MPGSVFLGGSVVAATVAGMIALFAPCCISVMLPAYFASSFQNRRRLVAMTFVFASGIATLILPITLGASVLLRLITANHTPLYVGGGLLMLGLGLYTLAGGKINIPAPGRGAGGGTGPLGVYSLGLFSGLASSCCAPVLAGLVALSGISQSVGLALALGVAYVFGMVFPLFLISLLWEVYDWRSSRLFHPRSFQWRMGPLGATIGASQLASGALLVLMGVGTAWIGFAGQSMPTPADWQARLTVWLQQLGHAVTSLLSPLPNWATALLLVAAAGLLARKALRELGWPPTARERPVDQPADLEESRHAQAHQEQNVP